WYNYDTPLQGQTSLQHISNLPLPDILNNSVFSIGWVFYSNQSVVNQPGLSLDNIVITGSTMLLTGNIAGPLCTGSGASVPYGSCALFNSDNVFTALLSDANGSFASPVN